MPTLFRRYCGGSSPETDKCDKYTGTQGRLYDSYRDWCLLIMAKVLSGQVVRDITCIL